MSTPTKKLVHCSPEITYTQIQQLTDDALRRGLTQLLGDDNRLEAKLVAHICEVDRRKLYRQLGYSSMFCFCVEELHLAEAVAYKRIAVAWAVRQYPMLLQILASGSLHLTGIAMLAPHLANDNVESLLASAVGKSKRDIERLLATTFPRPDVPAQIRKLPAPSRVSTSPASASTPGIADQHASNRVSGNSRLLPPSAPLPSSKRRTDRVAPLSADRFKVQFTADAALTSKVREAQELLGAQVGPGDLAALFSKALDVLLRELKNKKHGVTSKPRRQAEKPIEQVKATASSRTVPRSVRRQVYERDSGRCAYRSSDGMRCAERWGLEYHHRIAFGMGGASTVSNLELRCRSHNALAAELDYGVEKMARSTRVGGWGTGRRRNILLGTVANVTTEEYGALAQYGAGGFPDEESVESSRLFRGGRMCGFC